MFIDNYRASPENAAASRRSSNIFGNFSIFSAAPAADSRRTRPEFSGPR
jgi:hypothetical protein